MISLVSKLNKLSSQIKKNPHNVDPALLVEVLYKVVAYLNKFRSSPIKMNPDLIDEFKEKGPSALFTLLPVFYVDPDPIVDFLNRAGFDLVSSTDVRQLMTIVESLTDKVKIIGG